MIIYDTQGNEINNLAVVGGDARTDARPITVNLAALNAEVVIPTDNIGSVAIDVRGTFVGTLNVEASIDGSNYFSVPVYVPITEIFQVNITTAGSFIAHLPSPVRNVRVRMSAYTSGSAAVALRGDQQSNMVYAKPIPSISAGTVISAANSAATLTLAAPGAGLFHYITHLTIDRVNASAAAIAGSASLAYTTTNLPGTLAFTAGNALGVGEQKRDVELQVAGNPLKSVTANTATTIVAPAGGAGVVVRITALFYVGA